MLHVVLVNLHDGINRIKEFLQQIQASIFKIQMMKHKERRIKPVLNNAMLWARIENYWNC